MQPACVWIFVTFRHNRNDPIKIRKD